MVGTTVEVVVEPGGRELGLADRGVLGASVVVAEDLEE
jgi:hypothetical protein